MDATPQPGPREAAPLADLAFVFFDCQATAANLDSGHLLEIAWAVGSAASPPNELVQYRVALPPGESIPRRVSRITGIKDEDLIGVPALDEVAEALRAAWKKANTPFALAHYARYERAFVDALAPDENRRWICTHEIAKRALAGLPRKGLRAVAGYLGDPMHEVKRAGEHVRATAFIWTELVDELAGEGIETLEELEAYLEKPATKSERIFPLEREVRLGLPQVPGVYRMLGRDGTVLYVGKATSLKARVNSYYRGKRGQGSNKLELVSQVFGVDVTPVSTPLEAALLEADEIKRYSPAYNTMLRRRDRCVFFASPGFDSTSPRRDTRHTIGPLASTRLWESLSQLPRILGGQTPDEDWLVEVSEEVVSAGVALFCERHEVSSDFESLRSLGESIYLARQAEAEIDDEEFEGESTGVDGGKVASADAPDADEAEWTAESFAEYLEWQAIGLHRRATRGQWLTRLANSHVRYVYDGQERSLFFDNGELAESSPTDFDIETLSLRAYDRLNVLLTELRKFVRDDIAVHVEEVETWTPDDLSLEFARF